jgi:hypothetical protein
MKDLLQFLWLVIVSILWIPLSLLMGFCEAMGESFGNIFDD